MRNGTTRGILAVVLTHNAPRWLSRCIEGIAAQAVRPEAILAVDNASDPPVPARAPSVRLAASSRTSLPHQQRSCWRYAFALREFLSTGFDHAWVIDDDMVAEPGLAALGNLARRRPQPTFVFPKAVQPDGSIGTWGSWCGFLIARGIVERVGRPWKICSGGLRTPSTATRGFLRPGFPRHIGDDAIVHHDAVRREGLPRGSTTTKLAICSFSIST